MRLIGFAFARMKSLSRRTGNLPIRVRLFLITLGILLLFLSIIFITNTLLLKPYYNYMKEKKIVSSLQSIAGLDFSDTYEKGFVTEEMEAKLRSIETKDNIFIIILHDNLIPFYCDSTSMTSINRLDGLDSARQLFNSVYEMSGNKPKGNGTLSSPLISQRLNRRNGMGYLSLYAAVSMPVDGGSEYFHILINTPLSEIDDAVTAFNDYAYILGVFAMIISGLVSIVLCSRFVKPILDINNAAKRIADMDFGVKLDARSGDELGELAGSINHLSSELENKINQLSIANYKLKKDIEEREKIDIMRQELLSNVSHEFKTPLAIIMGYAEGLQLNINNDEKDYYCSVITDEAVKLNNIAARLLDLAELESGALMEFSDFSLSDLAEERLKTMSYIFAEHSITTGFKSTGKCSVTADYGRIEEVINNLLSNAQHHTPDGGHIAIDVKDTGETVSCTVFNSGSHIPEESISRIWESFYKVDKARTRKYGGSGLGLKIVSSVINLHGGSYYAENTDDGVVFGFSLPKNAGKDK